MTTGSRRGSTTPPSSRSIPRSIPSTVNRSRFPEPRQPFRNRHPHVVISRVGSPDHPRRSALPGRWKQRRTISIASGEWGHSRPSSWARGATHRPARSSAMLQPNLMTTFFCPGASSLSVLTRWSSSSQDGGHSFRRPSKGISNATASTRWSSLAETSRTALEHRSMRPGT